MVSLRIDATILPHTMKPSKTLTAENLSAMTDPLTYRLAGGFLFESERCASLRFYIPPPVL